MPNDLRQLLRFVPLRGWDAVEWRPLLSTLRSLSLRYVTGHGVAGLRRSVAEAAPDVEISGNIRGMKRLDEIATSASRRR